MNKKIINPFNILVCFLVLSACSNERVDSKEKEYSDQSIIPATAPSTSPSTCTDDCSPLYELAQMDNRTPVPLQPMMAWHQKQNMMAHLVAIEKIVGALADEDWEKVKRASATIESSPQMAQMCQHMGSGALGFTEMALDFHKRADAIGVGAKNKNAKAVLKATSNTLQACTTCHATYKQDVVSADTWTKRTGSDHVPNVNPGASH